MDVIATKVLKGQCHEIFASGFFRASSSPKPLIIALLSFQIFFQKLAEIFASPGATPVSMTPVANLPPIPLVSLIPAANLPPLSTTMATNNGNTIRLLTP